MKELILLSGLGADKRVFDFLDLKEYNVTYVEWISPLRNESIENYSRRLLSQIKVQKPILIGVSFGGIMAIEIGKWIDAEKIILISSAHTKKDIPLYYRLIGLLKINQLLPSSFLKAINSITFWFFGVKTTAEKDLLRSFIRQTDSAFLKWAIDKIVNWKSEMELSNVITIHGTHDRLLPNKKTDYQINKGGHLMIMNKSKEINAVLKKLLGE